MNSPFLLKKKIMNREPNNTCDHFVNTHMIKTRSSQHETIAAVLLIQF